jgi:hypothetical protein
MGGEMPQALYAHMNNKKIKIKKNSYVITKVYETAPWKLQFV